MCAGDIEPPISKIEQRLKEQQRGSNNKNEKVPCRWSVIFARVATYFVGEPRVLISTSDTEDLQSSTRSSNRELSKAQADSPAQLYSYLLFSRLYFATVARISSNLTDDGVNRERAYAKTTS